MIIHRSSKRIRSDLVFVENVEKIKQMTVSRNTDSEESSSEVGSIILNIPSKRTYEDDTLRNYYMCALQLRENFSKSRGYGGPWPPLANLTESFRK